MFAVLLVGLALCSSAPSEQPRRYDNYKVVEVHILNTRQQEYLQQLQAGEEYDFWTDRFSVGHPAHIMAAPEQLDALFHNLTTRGFKANIIVEDVQGLVPQNVASKSLKFDFTEYQRLDVVYAYMDELAAKHDHVTVSTIAETEDGRDMRLMTISTGGDGSKTAIYLDAMHHAREWITIPVALWVVTQLLNGEHQDLLDAVDFYFLPVVNPDGYEFSHTDERMWRKNRAKNQGSSCMGVDLNRNYGYHWGESGASKDPCSDIFNGPSAFSEIESSAVRDIVTKHKDQIKLVLTLHNYSQMFLSTYGYGQYYPEDHDDQLAMGKVLSDALKSVHGTKFKYGNSYDVIQYAAAGATDDFCKGTAGIKYVFTTELRDTGHYGFMLPADQIIESGEEYFAAFKAGVEKVISEYP